MISMIRPITPAWSNGARFSRRVSPCTRNIGGTPADKCKSDALFLTPKANSCVMSTVFLSRFDPCVRCARRLLACVRGPGSL